MPGDAAAPVSSEPPSCSRAHAWTRCVVTPQSMISAGSSISSGTAPTAGGGVHSPSRSRISLRRAMIGGQYFGPRAGPPVAHVSASSSSASYTSSRVSWKMSSRSLEEPVRDEQVAELADLVPPLREEPVVADELVLLDVREDRARQREQLLEPLPRVVVQQRGVLRRELLPRLGDVRGGPLDVRARVQRADVADQRRVRDARVVEPALYVW